VTNTTKTLMIQAALRGHLGQSEDNPCKHNTPAYVLYHRQYTLEQHRRAVEQSIEDLVQEGDETV
jgi:hypothetical protein